MSCEASGKIWLNGEMVEWEEATVHVLSHVVHYGSSVFEGIRCYRNSKGSAIFRLREHVKRLFDSAKIYRMDIPYTQDQISDAIVETVRENGLEECYIRPVVFRGYGEMGVHPVNCPVDVAVAAWEWGAYLGAEALEVGVDAGVSTWRRMAPNTMPNMAKAGGNYLNSQLAKMEAVRHGYDEAIMLDYHGYISEGSGENIFLVSEGEIYTPPVSSSLLRGITRDSVIKIARTEGVTVHEEPITREMLYIADEAFFTGTAVEITPIRSVDGIEIGAGRRGPVTKLLQDEFFRIIRAETEDSFGWLTYI